MTLLDVSYKLSELLASNRMLYLKIEPEVPDYTVGAAFKLKLFGNGGTPVEIEVTPNNIVLLMGMLDSTIFDKEQVDRLFVWNLKSLASYFHFITKTQHRPSLCQPSCLVLDLKIIESFLNVRKNPPENLVEAINRIKLSFKHKGWQPIYKSIHLPLALEVLPSMETSPLLNEGSKHSEFPYYEIEGQINGRLNCMRKFAKSFLPHNMGPDVRKNLKPRGYGYRFLCSDFRHCEVTVLQWLSGDLQLKEILDSGADLHSRLYEIITQDTCDSDNKRKLSKKIFLPVMYGLGASGLAGSLSVPLTVSEQLIQRIKTNFSTSWEWISHQQELAKQGLVLDHFGRPRLFGENETYLARNFAVQGVAATICQEKLIDLFKAIQGRDAYLAFSVHDGYGLVIKMDIARDMYRIVKDTCETESKLCPGLRMTVEIKFGGKLDSMKVLWKD